MKQNSDIDVLCAEINQHSDSYYEIVEDRSIQQAMGRWPLIVAINEDKPIKKMGLSVKDLIEESSDALTPSLAPIDNEILSESLISVQSQLKKAGLSAHTSQEEVTVTIQKLSIQEVSIVASSEAVEPAQSLPMDDLTVNLSTKGNLQSILAMASEHIKPASSQSISSLFERLNRS